MSNEYKEAYDRILNILYPGYSNMSPKRRDAIEFRATRITAYTSQIDTLFEQMKDPESPLYQQGASDKDIINIAAIYARIHEESNRQIASPTGKMLRSGEAGDVPVPEYKRIDRTESEVQHAITTAVEEYNSKPQISIGNIIKGIKKYRIDCATAKTVSEILKGIDANNLNNITKDNYEKEK